MTESSTSPPLSLEALLHTLAQTLIQHQFSLTSAESCTGGLIATHCTSLAGSSQWFERGFVTYSIPSKHEELGVSLDLINTFDVTSPEVAQAMALGALQHSNAHYSISTTGIAGPTGDGSNKPIGLVCFGLAWRDNAHDQDPLNFNSLTECHQFSGDREAVRHAAAKHGLHVLLQRLHKNTTSL